MNAFSRFALLPAFALPALLAWSGSAKAADILVNQLADVVDADLNDGVCDIDLVTPGEQCTLRAAVQTANALAGRDRILFASPGPYQLSIGGDGGAEVGNLDITQGVDILGYEGAAPTLISDLPLIDASAMSQQMFFTSGSADVLMRGLRLRGAVGGGAAGGAIGAYGTLTVDHCVFDYNTSATGAGIYVAPGAGLIVVMDSHFEHNRGAFGGAISVGSGAALSVERSSFLDNRATDGASAAFHLYAGAHVVIQDSTIDGVDMGPPIVGFSNRTGILAEGPQDLVLRNVTVSAFTHYALDMEAPAPANETPPFVRVANSVLHADGFTCRWQGAAGQDVMIAYSRVVDSDGCAAYYAEVSSNDPDLSDPMQDPGRYTWSRVPVAPFANVVDAGIPPDRPPPGPEVACTATDQRGNPRPVDGSGDDILRCDMGAIELPTPTTFEVNLSSDAVDDVPGDGACDIGVPVIGNPEPCTLRAAVMEANALAGTQRISFADDIDSVTLSLPAAPSASGGDLDLTEDVIINGRLQAGLPQVSIEQTVADERIFDIDVGPEQILFLRNLRLHGGESVSAFGGAIRMLDGQVFLHRSEFFDNLTANAGGAIAVQGGILRVEDADFHDNDSSGRGSALFASSGATLIVQRSSFHANTGMDGVGPVAAIEGEGGSGLAVLTSTIAANAAGIAVENPSLALLASLTVVDNTGAGIEAVLSPGEGIGLSGSIVHGNGALFGGDCSFPNGKQNAESNYVMDGDGNCVLAGATNFSVADPLLAPLAATPGVPGVARIPVFDVPMAQYSPALDVAIEHVCEYGDQLSRARPVDLEEVPDTDGFCDLGAVEVPSSSIFADGFED